MRSASMFRGRHIEALDPGEHEARHPTLRRLDPLDGVGAVPGRLFRLAQRNPYNPYRDPPKRPEQGLRVKSYGTHHQVLRVGAHRP